MFVSFHFSFFCLLIVCLSFHKCSPMLSLNFLFKRHYSILLACLTLIGSVTFANHTRPPSTLRIKIFTMLSLPFPSCQTQPSDYSRDKRRKKTNNSVVCTLSKKWIVYHDRSKHRSIEDYVRNNKSVRITTQL